MRVARQGRSVAATLAVCLLYATVMLASPGLHHDFECHMKSPGHCQACAANPLAPRAEPSSTLTLTRLLDAGAPIGASEPSIEAVVVPGLSGRSPPR